MRRAAAGLTLAAVAGGAEAGEVSANVALTTDYVFRGVSLTDGPAVQGGLDWTSELVYAGAWGSTLPDGIELDLYAGFTPTTGPVTWDFGLMGYVYPGAADDEAEFDYAELKVAGALALSEAASIGAGLYWAPENYGDTGDSLYVEINAGYAVNEALALSAALGRQSIEDPDGPFGDAGEDEYLTWTIGADLMFDAFALNLSYHDTDIKSGADIEAYTYGPSSYDAALVLTLSRGL